jgi:hypothetical protein
VRGALLVPREEGDLQKSHRISQVIVVDSIRAPKDFNGNRNAKP